MLVFFEVTKRKRNVLNKFERSSVGVYGKILLMQLRKRKHN